MTTTAADSLSALLAAASTAKTAAPVIPPAPAIQQIPAAPVVAATPAAPAATAAPVAPTVAWYTVDPVSSGVVPVGSTGELIAKISSGYGGLVRRADDNAWRSIRDYTELSAVAPAGVGLSALLAPAEVSAPTTANTVVATVASLPQELITGELASEEDADRVLALLSSGGVTGTSLSDIIDDMDQGGMRLAYPQASLRRGNWTVHKSTDDSAMQVLPAGTRPWTGIYLGHRLGAQLWVGDGQSGSGKPPIGSFVVPNPVMHAGAEELQRRVLAGARKVQFSAKEERYVFDEVGRIVPELQLLFWHPGIPDGFCVLTISTFNSVMATTAAIDSAVRANGATAKPVRVDVVMTHTQNKKLAKADPTAKNAEWDVPTLGFSVDASPSGAALRDAFGKVFAANRVKVATVIRDFNTGIDYRGLSVSELSALLLKYDNIVVKKRNQ